MAVPTTRADFKEYCLRALGKPVIDINVADTQVEDRIDEALSYYADYHFDASAVVYYKHQITTQNITDKYITLPENILGAVRIFQLGGWGMTSTNDIFNINYQIALNDLYTLASSSMIPYYMLREKLGLMQEMLVGQQLIRYERHRNRLHVDMNWEKVEAGQYLVVEAYEVVDPAVFADVWKDRWLYRYATALIKKQWGLNLTKFVGVQMPGGVQFNGQQILQDAQDEIRKMEEEMITTYSLPPSDMVG